VHRSVTWQQASKHKNKSIICGTLSTFQSHHIAVSGVKGSGRNILKSLIQTLWDVALFQLVKGNLPLEIIAYICRVQHRINNGFLFTKIGKLCLLY
jgi:hypothetical protein